MNEQEKERIRLYVYKKLKENSDLFDVESEMDSSLTYDENINIIADKIECFREFNPLNDISRADIKLIKESREAEEVTQPISFNYKIEEKLIDLFSKPKVIGVIANVNEGKSNLLYYIIEELNKNCNFNLYTYGFRTALDYATNIHSVSELEQIHNSVIIIDELFSLFDLDNRKVKAQIENTLRLINHHNNILVLCGVGENFKKFLSAKINVFIYKQISYEDLINGSKVKNVILNYKGMESGTTLLGLDKNEALIYDGKHYEKMTIPYMSKFDSKVSNVNIVQKSVPKNVPNKVIYL